MRRPGQRGFAGEISAIVAEEAFGCLKARSKEYGVPTFRSLSVLLSRSFISLEKMGL